MARRPKRSPEAIREAHVREWRTMAGSGNCYAGFGICPRCPADGVLRYRRGRSYERQMCFDCWAAQS